MGDMVPVRTILVGRDYNRFQRNLDLLYAVGLLIGTFAAYGVGFFQVTGGVIVLPEDATLVGFVAAVGIGIRRGGLLIGWALPFAAYLGFRADWALLGLSSHSFVGKIAFFFAPVGLGILAVAAIIIGTLGFITGHLFRWCLGVLRQNRIVGGD
jgi:hypothetical protein